MYPYKQKLKELFSLEYDKASNKEIREAIISGANVKGTNMAVLMIAIFIASIGLNMNSTAVIIGAMLISPLMGGIMAIGYGMATNDLNLVRKSFIHLAAQVFICIFTSTLYFTITPISAARSELLARTNPTIWDVLIALLGGLAGTIGVTRKEKTNVIPGVAIATALMPPLCTVGYGLATHSPKFVLGAFYLFFINSFFIGLSSFIIIRLMRLPKKSNLDEHATKKVQLVTYLITVLTIIPSILLAYQIVTETVFENNVQHYISNELVFDDTQVVRSYVTEDKKQMVVALLGKRISNDMIALLQAKLEYYNLGGLELKVTQTETGDTISYDMIQDLIEQELNAAHTEVALSDRDNQIELLKSELVTYKSQLLDYQSTEYDTASLAKELKALFPSITSFSLEHSKVYQVESDTTHAKLIAIIDSTKALSDADKTRIEDWLKVKTSIADTSIEGIELYINVPTPTPMPSNESSHSPVATTNASQDIDNFGIPVQ